MGQLTRPQATVDLDALARNYRQLAFKAGGRLPAGVVKADGYGLGAVPVARRLLAEGCTRFFVARLDEGLALRSALAAVVDPPAILVLDGVQPGTEDELVGAGLVPVLNDLGQIERWQARAATAGRALRAALHFDTGMTRLGIPAVEADQLSADPSRLNGIATELVMSHLASADVDGSPQSAEQLSLFAEVRSQLPMGTASLANSAGIFLGPKYHFDLARPGISLYGGSPFPDSGRSNPMRSVVTLEAPIIQVRSAHPGESVGYGATHQITADSRIATIPVGYADGFLRSISNRGMAAIDGVPVPIIGRVSMDLITLDVSGVDQRSLHPGAPVELLGENCPIDEVADRAGSIPHEFLTNLSRRFELRYLPATESLSRSQSEADSHSY